MTDHPNSPDGAAIAQLAITVGLLANLQAKRVLSEREVTDIIELAMLRLEEVGLDGQGCKAAHETLEKLLPIGKNKMSAPT